MYKLALFALYAASCVQAIPSVPPGFFASYSLKTRTETSTRGCQQLKDQFPNLVFYPNTTRYVTESTDFYSSSAILSPWCVFTPKTSQNVADGLKILRQTRTQFAVRGGGHTPIKGAASTDHGVLIPMDNLNHNEIGTFNGKQVAKIGPGQRWVEVYGWLEQFNLMVMGGRYAPVGVGGLLIGGGLSYFASARGWAADYVLNYELVTADSQILQVNVQSYPDLFWAMKGGSSNYGIVTRFDLATFPRSEIWAGFVFQDGLEAERLVQTVGEYVDPVHGGSLDPKSAVDASLFYDTQTASLTCVTSLFYNGSVDGTPAAFTNFTSIPTISSTVGVRTYGSWLTETLVNAKSPTRKLWVALSLKSTPAAIKLAGDIFRAEIKNLKPLANGTFTLTYQPLTTASIAAARANGGDAIDLDPADGPVTALLFTSDYLSAADDTYVDTFLKNLYTRTKTAAQQQNLYYPFIFLNDAGGWQKTLSLYGNGKSFARMQEVARKWDPKGVFQTLAAGAFKISEEGGKWA